METNCCAKTSKNVRCSYKAKQFFGIYGSCMIKAHIAQVQDMTSEAPPQPAPAPSRPVTALRQSRKNGTIIQKNATTSYQSLKKLGKGVYGDVHKVIIDGKEMAIKRQKAISSKYTFKTAAFMEAVILKKCNHPNVVKAVDVFTETDKKGYKYCNIVMDLASDALKMFATRPLATNISYTHQILQGLEYLHKMNIIHCDIKPPNILVYGDTLKIADFGLAQYDFNQKKRLEIQTFWYRAPEVFLGDVKYTSAIDMWSLGVMIHDFITGSPLSTTHTEDRFYEEICRIVKDPLFLENVKKKSILDGDINDLLSLMAACLEFDPSKRITAKQALNLPMFSSFPRQQITDSWELPKTPVIPQFDHLFNTFSIISSFITDTSVERLVSHLYKACDLDISETSKLVVCFDLAQKFLHNTSLFTGHYTKYGIEGRDVIYTLQERICNNLEFKLF